MKQTSKKSLKIGLEASYNKGKETPYTEEQLRMAYEYGNNYHKGSIADAQEYTFEKLIKLLKPSKKD